MRTMHVHMRHTLFYILAISLLLETVLSRRVMHGLGLCCTQPSPERRHLRFACVLLK